MGSVASVVGVVVALLLSKDFRNWIYPLPLVAGLGMALVASWVWFFIRLRGPGAPDQERLDATLAALPRDAMRALAAEDFGIAWERNLNEPLRVYVGEFGHVEHRFDDRRLEEARAQLHRAATTLTDAEGQHSFSHPNLRDRSYVGISESQLEADPSQYDLFEMRRGALHAAAGEVLGAYDALIAIARERGYRIGADRGGAPHRL